MCIRDSNGTTGLKFRFDSGGFTNIGTVPDSIKNDSINQTFIAGKITDATTFRGNIGAGTSSFSGSAGDLTGNLSPDRLNISNFPLKGVITAANQAGARSAIGAGTSNFDGAYGSLSGTPTIPPVVSFSGDNILLDGVSQGAVKNSALNIGNITGSPFDSSGNLDSGETITVGAKITIDRNNERILIAD